MGATILNGAKIGKNCIIGANSLVKKASRLKSDNLPDDTTAVIVEILKENEVEILKALDLTIPINLKVGQIIDGYILEKSLIQNNRTWICEKNGKKICLKISTN